MPAALAEPVAATCLSDIVRLTASAVYHKGRRRIPLHLRFRIGHKTLTEWLASKRPPTAAPIGRHYPKPESQREMRIPHCRVGEGGDAPKNPPSQSPISLFFP